jgi:hypothetical protein
MGTDGLSKFVGGRSGLVIDGLAVTVNNQRKKCDLKVSAP